MSGSPHGTPGLRGFIHSLGHSPGLGRLLAVRLTSQITDGVFQAALFGAILFNPERHADPLAIAGGLAVLLLPYSVIGPFAGALLDHWDRRNVLMYANVIRGALIALVALCIATGTTDTVVLIGALAVTGASRFVASGLSASLPHVAHRDVIVATNALFTTLGAGMLAVGAGIAAMLRALFGPDNSGSALTTLGGVAIALVAATVAHGFGRLQLGPDEPDDPGRSAFHAVTVGLLHGARAVGHSRTVSAALSAIGAHRLVFGMNTLMLLVLSKHAGLGDGLAGVTVVAGFTAGGAFLAAVVTPYSVERFGRRITLVTALLVGAVAELSLLTFNAVVFCIGAFVLGLIGQVAKLCGDVAMQVDIGDAVRGQVFSVQDAVFNIAYVGAVALAAFAIPENGRSIALVVLGTVVYLIGAVVVRLLHTPHHPRHHTVNDDRIEANGRQS
ncbi:MFS transporter [Gordonia insulae]|uniref:Putative MFS-type transporter n=1 Tax=Gordonia insulae TaxID=2420509 RepID=A0A3G8JPJ6_9ACTN|nr:MFS transporter [Gordonia insulae]AZG47001.1 putative MFS-type transporter [Gordonia insulae]